MDEKTKTHLSAAVVGVIAAALVLGMWLAYLDHLKVQKMWDFLSSRVPPSSQQPTPTPSGDPSPK